MDRSTRDRIWARAASRCEYCRIAQAFEDATHEIDHVISEKHHGPTEDGNLALACFSCNNHKGPNVAGVDIESGDVTRLYHPRRDKWDDHFVWSGPFFSSAGPPSVVSRSMC